MDSNFQIPESDLNSTAATLPVDQVFEQLRRSLKIARPWILFVAVLGGLSTVLLMFLVLVGSSDETYVNIDNVGSLKGLPATMIQICLVLVYFLPTMFLFRYSQMIGLFLAKPDMKKLEQVLLEQAWFWRSVGVIIVSIFGLNALSFIAGVILLLQSS